MRAVSFVITAVLARLASSGASVVFPILAFRELHDVGVGALLLAASLAPSVVVAPLAGALLDASRRPRILFAGAGLVSAAGYAAGALLGILPLGVIALALLAAGCATPFVMGGLSSFVTTIIDRERTAFASDTLAYSISGVGGPALSAALIVIATPRAAAFTLAAASLLGAVSTLLLHVTPHHAARNAGLWSRIREGLSYLVRHRPIRLVTSASTLTQLGAGAFPIAAVALSVQRWQHPDDGAWIVTAFSIGSLVSALVVAVRPIQRVPAATVMTVGFTATGALTILAGLHVSLAFTVIVVAAAGLFSSPSVAALFELRTANSTPEVRAQVFTVGAGLRAAASAAGAAMIGPFTGVDATLLVALVGVAWLASAAIMLPYGRARADAERMPGAETPGGAIADRA